MQVLYQILKQIVNLWVPDYKNTVNVTFLQVDIRVQQFV